MNKALYLTFSAILFFVFTIIPACKNPSSSSGDDWSESENKYVFTDVNQSYDVLIVDNDDNKYNMYAEVKDDSKDLYVGVFNTDYATLRDIEIDSKAYNGMVMPGLSSSASWMERISTSNYKLSKKISEYDSAIQNGIDTIPPRLFDFSGESEGDAFTFNDDGLDYDCHLRELRTITTEMGNKTLKIWVEDNSWTSGGSETYLVNQTMVDFIADEFMVSGDFNDIYDWVTNIFGEEWSSHSYSNLIADLDEINIVVADLLHDNLDSGIMGYFWAKDNFIKTSGTGTSTDISNERLTFYIESQYLAHDGGGSWSPDNELTLDTISTLAHEFQHMINFYQTAIVRNITQETWLNELLSMSTEDLLSEKLDIEGPKGFTTSDGVAPGESSNISLGRIPLFNQYPYSPFDTWLSGDNVLLSYSLMYCYGAYLMRNFGGPEVLNSLYDVSGRSDFASALEFKTDDPDITENTILLFNAAVILSDRTDINSSDYLKFNNNGWFEYNYGGENYKLSSINFFSYSRDFFTVPSTGNINSLGGRAFVFKDEASNISGKYQISTASDTPDADTYVLILK